MHKDTLSTQIFIYLLCIKLKLLETKRIVITGGPGSGKTALISNLEKKGFDVMHEISRDITLKAQKEGIAQLFLEKPILFSEKLLEGRLKQFHQAKESKAPILFYDRGMPDIVAYMDFASTEYPNTFSEACLLNRYDEIFLLPPWEAIYEQDNERYESFEEAEKIFHYLKTSYENYEYDVHKVPIETVEKRVDLILKKLKIIN